MALKAIATRSWGRFRTHLNVVHGFGDGSSLPAAEAAPRWGGSLAADLLSIRRSTLFLLEVRAAQSVVGGAFEWAAATGLRAQLAPTLVFDLGVATSISRDDGNERSLTLGLSHAFGIAALWPRGAK